MGPSASSHHPRRAGAHADDDDGSTIGALVIAILFALLALISFAVDYSITLPSHPVPPPVLQTPR
ncbi:MAG: hypothetical protein AB7H90_15340 [Alphaproteobacteria bacterium]